MKSYQYLFTEFLPAEQTLGSVYEAKPVRR